VVAVAGWLRRLFLSYVVFFDELQVDVGGGVIAVIEFATVDAEELESLVKVGFGELGLQELGELREVESLGFG